MSNILPAEEIIKNPAFSEFFSVFMYIPTSQAKRISSIPEPFTACFSDVDAHTVENAIASTNNSITSQHLTIFEEISQILCTLGVPTNLLGYSYLRYSVFAAAQDQEYLHGITKRLYPDVAKHFHTTAPRVERAIRHAIDVSCSRGDPSIIQNYFGNTINPNSGKPTNAAFISRISDSIRMRQLLQTGLDQ